MSQQADRISHLDGELNIQELHGDLARKHHNVGSKIDTIWRSFTPKQREKAVRSSIADGSVLKHRYDRSYGVLCDYIPEYNLREMASKPEHFLDIFNFRASTRLRYQLYEGADGGPGDREVIEKTGVRHYQFADSNEIVSFLEDENYGKSFQLGPTGLPFERANLVLIPRYLGGPIALRQQFLFMYLNYLVEDILKLGSDTRNKGAPEHNVNEALVSAVSNLNIRPKPLKSSFIKVCMQATESKAALEDYLLLLRTEPIVLNKAADTMFWSRVELVSDDRGRMLPLITDQYLSAAFFESVTTTIKAIAIWDYILRLLQRVENVSDKVKKSLILQELTNTCHLEYRRTQEILKRTTATRLANKRFKRMTDKATGLSKLIMKGQPADCTISDPQMHYILRLCHSDTTPAAAVQWIQKLDDHNARHDDDRKKLSEAEMTALGDLVIIVSFMHMMSTAIPMVPVSRKSGLLFTARSNELELELNILKSKADFGDFIIPLENLLEPNMADGALAALDDYVVEQAGARLGSLYEDTVQDSLQDLEKMYAEAKFKRDKADRTTYVPLPEEKPSADARMVDRRAKEKTRPTRSSVYTVTALRATSQIIVTEPKQGFQVKAPTASVFATLFSKSEARGSVAWTDFEAAMADLKFSVTPKGGSIFTFNPPASMSSSPITLHRPHMSGIEGHKLLIFARRLHRAYGWGPSSFIVA